MDINKIKTKYIFVCPLKCEIWDLKPVMDSDNPNLMGILPEFIIVGNYGESSMVWLI